jgi:hypothetical protein
MTEAYRDPEHHIWRRLWTPGYWESNFDKMIKSLATVKDYKNKVEKILQFGPVNWKKLEELNVCYEEIARHKKIDEIFSEENTGDSDEKIFNLAQAEENNLTSSRMSKMSRRNKY